jgi:hypothetical protein
MDEFGLLTLGFNGRIKADYEHQDYNNSFIDFKVVQKIQENVNLNFTWEFVSISKNKKEMIFRINFSNLLDLSSGIHFD